MYPTIPALRHRCLDVLFTAALVLSAVGCQSSPNGTGGTPSAAAKAAPAKERRPVAVYDFAFDVAVLRPDEGPLPGRDGPARRIRDTVRPGESPAQKAERLARVLSESIAKELAALGFPATRLTKDTPWPDTGFVVQGEFLQVDEGNRMKRAVVGFGAGATEAQARVEVYDVARDRTQPILVSGASAGSKPTPGGVVTMNPYAMAARYVLTRNATEKDVRALGKQIAGDLARVETETVPKP